MTISNKQYRYYKILIALAFVLLSFKFTFPSYATLYSLSNGSTEINILPITTAQTAEEYYSYGGWDGSQSGDPAFGTESNTAFFWLYEFQSSITSLCMIYNTEGMGGYGRIYTTISGLPLDSFFQVKDDPVDINQTLSIQDGKWSFRFTWRDHTDGAVIQLGNYWKELSLAISGYDDFEGIDNAYYLSNNFMNPERIALDLSNPIKIRPVPEPTTFMLISVGFIGLVHGCWRKKWTKPKEKPKS